MILALLFVVSLPAVTARLYSSDEVEYFSYLRSLYFDGDVSFDNEYRYFYDHDIAQSAGFHETFLERQTAAGRRVNYATMGSAILWLPFYAAADLYARATGTAEANGFTQPYISAVAYGSAFYGFLAVLLSVRAARLTVGHGGNTEDLQSHGRSTEKTLNDSLGRRGNTGKTQSDPLSRRGNTGEKQGDPRGHRGNTEETLKRGRKGLLTPALAVWFGTPLLFYMYVAPPFSHACSAFAVALFVNVWLHVRRDWSPRGAFALGLCTALMAMVREQDVFLAIGPLVDFLWATTTPGSTVRTGLAGVAGTLLGYSPHLLAYNALNGYPGPAEHVSRKMYWYAPHAIQVLASPHHGFFFWTPLALLAIGGLFVLRNRRVMVSLLIMVGSQVYIAGSVGSWTVAGAFGQRRFVCLTVILVIGLTALWNASRFPRRGLGLAVALCVWWNVALMAQFATRLMDRQRLEPARNAYHAFVTLPLQAPSLVYRYLTDRESFYESRPAGANR